MATKAKKSTAKKTGNGPAEESKLPYGKKNYLVFAAALIVILLGFWTLAEGSITWAPILLVAGYCVLLPIALFIKDKPEEDDTPQPDQS